jgi:hypothetical protein
MKKPVFLLFVFVFAIFSMAFTQTTPTLTLDIAPYGNSPFWYGETINFDYEWKLDGDIDELPQACVETFTILDNGGATIVKRPGNNLDVTWGAQKSTTARVNINLKQCSTTGYNKDYPSSNYSVMSIVGETPASITGTGNVPVCQSTPLTYSTSGMSIPNGINRAADGYE